MVKNLGFMAARLRAKGQGQNSPTGHEQPVNFSQDRTLEGPLQSESRLMIYFGISANSSW
jgi:hypothetical protein